MVYKMWIVCDSRGYQHNKPNLCLLWGILKQYNRWYEEHEWGMGWLAGCWKTASNGIINAIGDDRSDLVWNKFY